VFARAYRLLMDKIDQVITTSTLGDGFDPIPADVPAPSWEDLGLALPPAPGNAAPPPPAIDRWPTHWVMVAPGADAPPAVQFAFPAPQDAYRGEATEVSGSLTLGADAGGSGVFAGATEAFPESFFVLETTEAAAVSPNFGVLTPAVMRGTFTMKGHTVPLVVTASLEPITANDGSVRLVLDARWTLGLLNPFGIDGPSGDEETGDFLEFSARLVFAPAGGE